MTSFFLKPRAPFRLDLTVWALRRRRDNIVDRWDGQTYRRVLPVPSGPVEVAVTQHGSARLRVSVEGSTRSHKVQDRVTADLERLLGIRRDLSEFHQLAEHDALLGPLANRFDGMKPPRFATVFEDVVTAIANQQVSLNVGILLLGRLAVNYGASVRKEDAEAHAFPEPKDLATAEPSVLRELGFSLQKGKAIVELAKAIVAGDLDLEALAKLSDEEAIEHLRRIRGIGRWSAEYVLLRGMGRTNIFPGDDVGARNNLERFLKTKKPLDYKSVNRALARWHPYAGLVYFHLLLDRLSEAGFLTPETELRHGNRTTTEEMNIKIKRVYELPAKDDGTRILVDRLWPRGLTKQKAKVDLWLKEIAPSTELRKWFGHDPEKWEPFQKRYRQELKKNKSQVSTLKEKMKEQAVTLLYGAKDEKHNEALVLLNYLKRK